MSYVTYKLMHFLGIFTVLVVLAASSMRVVSGGPRADNPYGRLPGTAHGVALFLIITGGFGMLARLGLLQDGMPRWVLLIWIALTLAVALPRRGRAHARALLIALPLLALAGGAVALFK